MTTLVGCNGNVVEYDTGPAEVGCEWSGGLDRLPRAFERLGV